MNRNDEQLEFMLCESLNARGAVMPEAVREWLAGNPQAVQMQQEYVRLDALLKGWRALPVNLNLKNYAARISGAVAEASDTRDLAGLVPHWSGPVPEVDYSALKSRISAAVLRESLTGSRMESQRVAVKRRRVVSWMGRIAAPLAVAAAIALAVWWPHDVAPGPSGGSQMAKVEPAKPQSMVVVALDAPSDTGKVKIKFDEADRQATDPGSDQDSGMAIGGADDVESFADDDAFLY